MNEALERANGTQRARAGVRAVAPSRSTPPTGTYVLAIEIGSRLGVVGCAAFLGASGVHAQQSAPSSLVALEIDGGVRIDGVLDEEAWERAQKVSNFTQRELDVGEPATERTQVAVLFDDDALYVGFWGFDSDANGIRATQMARDFSWTSDDNFEVILDPFDDNRTGYLFVTNANGARADALIAANGSSTNRDWDGVWDVRSRRTDEGWFAELRIPFSTLRFPTEVGRGWGINFERNIRRKREQLLWQGWSRDYNLETLSQAGSLEGLAGLGGTKLLEARPFGVGGSEWRSGQPRDRVADVGLDLSWLATPSWRINFTVRPDFAQVESDREEVNLTRFPLFFPEKRNFFLEGNEFFDFNLGGDVQPFYSRRIGLAEDRTEVPIDGGARVLGRQGKTSIGAMALRTAGTPSEDAANFGVVRWRQDVLDESSIGVLAVARGGAGSSNITYGADGRYASSELFGDKEFAAGGAVAQTYASDAADRVGVAHRLFVSYPNDLIEFSASWARADSAFNPEVGFVRRSDYQRFASELALLPRPRFLPGVQQLEIKPFEISWYESARTGELQSLYAEFVPLAFTLRTGDEFEFNIQRRQDRPGEDFELVEGAPDIPAGEYWFTRWAIDLSSYGARPLSGSIEMSGGEYYLGNRYAYALSARWRASRHLTVSGDWEHNRIELSGTRVGVNEASARLDVAISPTLFGAIAGQWNNEDDEVIVNFRLNWIPQPGSDLFLVINQLADSGDVWWRPRRTTLLSKLVWRFVL
jgi:hypothetical protein